MSQRSTTDTEDRPLQAFAPDYYTQVEAWNAEQRAKDAAASADHQRALRDENDRHIAMARQAADAAHAERIRLGLPLTATPLECAVADTSQLRRDVDTLRAEVELLKSALAAATGVTLPVTPA